MKETLHIRRFKTESKSSRNGMVSVNVQLDGNKSLLPSVDIGDTISLNDIFVEERAESEKYRLVVELSPVISNSLFNNVTEVVGTSGSNVVSLNYGAIKVPGTYHKENVDIDNYEAVRDTQFSNDTLGFKYYCGRDIFNNHILRNKSFKSVCKFGKTNEYCGKFNTIEDFMRLPDGTTTKSHLLAYSYYGTQAAQIDIDSHLYEIKDIYPFAEAIENRLIERDGWFGFENKQTITVYDENDKTQDIHRVINSEPAASLITMYPGKKEYSLIPQYNDFSGELENNWHFCITYPSSSTTEGIKFIYDNGLCLRAINIGTKLSNGTYAIEMFSFSKHGLVDGDVVNVYRKLLDDDNEEPEMVIQSEEVSVNDDFSFSVSSSNFNDGNDVEIGGLSTGDTTEEKEYCYYFKRVVDGIECKYYVRIFSRLPNFKFADQAVTPQTLYGEGADLIDRYQSKEYDFENHVSSMAFAQTIYGDKTCQIVFTDDIDLSCLRDNLGRPLTDIYLTVVKNNRGYKDWYGVGKKNWTPELNGIERSHCFGKLTCGFELDEGVEFSECNRELSNAMFLNNVEPLNDDEESTSVSGLVNINQSETITDEIDYDTDKHYYGDLCCYSPNEQIEDIIQPILFRFSTAQRELNPSDGAYSAFSSVTYDELIVDDNFNISRYIIPSDSASTPSGFTVKQRTVGPESLCRRKEGYIYNPHFRIGLRHVSIGQQVRNAFTFRCMSIKSVDNGTEVYTEFPNYANLGEDIIFFDISGYTATKARITNIIDGKKFVCDATFEEVPDEINTILIRRPEDIPMYADFLTDGSCTFTWRPIVRNGDENDVGYDEYPFANGRHYATKRFNLFLRRQDPLMESGLQTIPENDTFSDPIGRRVRERQNGDTYYKEKESEC